MLNKTKSKILMIGILTALIPYWTTNSLLFAARPLSTDDAETVNQAKSELEIGYETCKKSGEPNERFCEFSFKHGITEKMDIGLSVPYWIEPPSNEKIGNCSVGVKFSLVKDIFSFSVTNEFGSSAFSINTIFSHTLGPIVLHFNFGYEATGNRDVEGKITYSTAFEKSFRKFDIVGEILGDKIGFQNYLFGIRYNLTEGFAIDAGYGNGFRGLEEKITLGCRYEF